ncbi:cupin domain-containing protein [Sphingosinicella sp.]|uniref:cupin domain-containing protein n=1 Tax=Sphingosinicella sp. TaxID=1917971 RepID=UPI004037D021
MATRKQALKAVDADGHNPSWEEDALGFLIAPVAREEFLASIYEQKELLNLRHEPDRYADLLTLDSLDQFIASADLREGMLDLSNKHNRITREAYLDEDGRVIQVAVTEEYLRGATIILPHLHSSMYNLGEFCRSLEEVFTCHVQTNIYLTPPSREEGKATQGFPPHYDNHDVFVMQIAGSKAWRIYGTPVTTPFRGETFEVATHQAGEPSQTFTMNAGDCIYMPRGLMHDAENSGDEPSLHITVGLITKTWADLLLESISELALTEPAFRRSLPAGYADRAFDREAAARYFDELINTISDKAQMDSAFDLLADNFIRARQPNISGVIAASRVAPTPDDRYCRRRYAPWNVAEDDDGKLVLIGPGGDLDFKQEEGDALERALSGTPFIAADLKCENPDELLQRLWAAGYLERVG